MPLANAVTRRSRRAGKCAPLRKGVAKPSVLPDGLNGTRHEGYRLLLRESSRLYLTEASGSEPLASARPSEEPRSYFPLFRDKRKITGHPALQLTLQLNFEPISGLATPMHDVQYSIKKR